MKITVKGICDYELDLDYGRIHFNTLRNALKVKRILEVDGSIPNQATVCDMQEVVRCKDCKYLMFSDMYGECARTYMGIVSPTDFCSRGVGKG